MISRYLPAALTLCVVLGGSALVHARESSKEAEHENSKSSETGAEDKESLSPRHLSDESQTTPGAITLGGRKIAYQAEAG
ncbi:MAG TPA: hypothetical protein VI653_21755, partial [Steroidobacteraceae bacterium]